MTRAFVGIFSLLMLVLVVSYPYSASAFIKPISFGGRVTSEVPCVGPLGPSLYVTIASMRVGVPIVPEFYIYTPITLVKQIGPPIIGGQILGVADIPYTCFVFVPCGLTVCPVPLAGLRVFTAGTSLPSVTI